MAAELEGVPADHLGLGPPDEAVAPGVYEVELPRDSHVLILLGSLSEGGADLTFESSLELVVYEDDDDDRRLRVGDRVEGVVDGLELEDRYPPDLEDGEEVRIRVASPAGTWPSPCGPETRGTPTPCSSTTATGGCSGWTPRTSTAPR